MLVYDLEKPIDNSQLGHAVRDLAMARDSLDAARRQLDQAEKRLEERRAAMFDKKTRAEDLAGVIHNLESLSVTLPQMRGRVVDAERAVEYSQERYDSLKTAARAWLGELERAEKLENSHLRDLRVDQWRNKLSFMLGGQICR